MSDRHLDIPGSRLAYDVSGAGGRVVIVAHGLGASRAAEDAEGVFDWSAVAADARLVRYDARGHGVSTGRAQPSDYRWAALADDLLALADAVSPDAPVDAIGASMGTATIIWAATRRPERFRRLVLSIPPTAWETRANQGNLYRAGADLVEREGMDGWRRAMAAAPSVPILEQGGWAFDRDPDVRADLLPSVFRGAAGSDFPDADVVATIGHETLLLPWATDSGHPVSTAERLAELLPSATLEVAETPDTIRGWGVRAAAFLHG
ncbi:alpha/beta fold hydrolase [Curtobacterium sp. MCBD17_028]|uniref:alpha/beta fold hydrolase n=1 Tax=Curtobacterium sp. MCBD17_028 TaxID=2175670 RepID=UPI000DAAC2E3|nr:alpha/beta hydrolase [Curtobacterium sp. MCBD17_028]PZE24390.1 alpha/beta hydrolase [Curtobacterium sp. MCBD17_028]